MPAKRKPTGIQNPNERIMLRQLVREFSAEMRNKLLLKADAGWGGWDIKAYGPTLKEKLACHLVRALDGDAKQWVVVRMRRESRHSIVATVRRRRRPKPPVIVDLD